MTIGIPAGRLSDDDLRHELLQLKKKQDDIQSDGTDAQQANHRRRTAELEAEFLERFGGDAPGGDARADDTSGADPASGDVTTTVGSETAADERPAGAHRAE